MIGELKDVRADLEVLEFAGRCFGFAAWAVGKERTFVPMSLIGAEGKVDVLTLETLQTDDERIEVWTEWVKKNPNHIDFSSYVNDVLTTADGNSAHVIVVMIAKHSEATVSQFYARYRPKKLLKPFAIEALKMADSSGEFISLTGEDREAFFRGMRMLAPDVASWARDLYAKV